MLFHPPQCFVAWPFWGAMAMPLGSILIPHLFENFAEDFMEASLKMAYMYKQFGSKDGNVSLFEPEWNLYTFWINCQEFSPSGCIWMTLSMLWTFLEHYWTIPSSTLKNLNELAPVKSDFWLRKKRESHQTLNSKSKMAALGINKLAILSNYYLSQILCCLHVQITASCIVISWCRLTMTKSTMTKAVYFSFPSGCTGMQSFCFFPEDFTT